MSNKPSSESSPENRSASIQSLVGLPPAERIEALETLRKHLTDGPERGLILEEAKAWYLLSNEALDLGTLKVLLRLLAQFEDHQPDLETSILDKVQEGSPLFGHQVGALGGCGGLVAVEKMEAWNHSAKNYSPFTRRQLSIAQSRLHRRFATAARWNLDQPAIPEGLFFELHGVQGMETWMLRSLSKHLRGLRFPEPEALLPGLVTCKSRGSGFSWEQLSEGRLHSDCCWVEPISAGSFEPGDWAGLATHIIEQWPAMKLGTIVTSTTMGPIRFAVRLNDALHAPKSWLPKLARTLEERCNASASGEHRWVNEPRDEDWIFELRHGSDGFEWALRLDRKHWDRRFDYRKHLLPAASKPTVSAFLASWAGSLPKAARVMDPFCGSGTELIEIAKANKRTILYGSDIDPVALEACRANMDAADVSPEKLRLGDFREWALSELDLIITNPPFGRRTKVDEINELLESFLTFSWKTLREGGQVCWITPQPKRSRFIAKRLGFTTLQRQSLDLGGMKVEAQLLEKRLAPGSDS
jgi:predicted RNA methylase